MVKKRRAVPARLLPWLSAGVTCALAVGLIIQCAAIYAAGKGFSREMTAGRLRALLPLAGLWLLAAISAAIVWKPEQPRYRMEAENALRLLRPRVAETEEMLKEQRNRQRGRWIAGAVLALCWGSMAIYLLNPAHFTDWNLEMVLGEMVKVIALPGALSLVAGLGWERYAALSYEREWALAKNAPRRSEPPAVRRENSRHTAAWRTILYVLAAALVAWGIMNGGMYDVLVKAINICTECIGLG